MATKVQHRAAAGRGGAAGEPRPDTRKKTLQLDQRLLDRARRALGVKTETAAVTQALEAVVLREAQAAGIRRLGEIGPIDPDRVD